jgi:hypothetical protein
VITQAEPPPGSNLTAGFFDHGVPFRISGQIHQHLPYGIRFGVNFNFGLHFLAEQVVVF